jgi:transcriptional regulator with XRE-family HTH domain
MSAVCLDSTGIGMAPRARISTLRKARLKRGWSQEVIGQKLGTTGAAIGHYETGVSSQPQKERQNRRKS